MKKIVFLFLTFSGICAAMAQRPEDSLKRGPDSPLLKGDRPSVRVFPNPARNKVELEIKGFSPGNLQVQIIDMNGLKIRDEKRFAFRGNEVIVLMFSINPGIYLLLVRQDKKQAGSRLVVQGSPAGQEKILHQFGSFIF